MTRNSTLILGIGNTLLADEGAGIHALNHLQSEYPEMPDVTFLDGGTLSFTLATWIENCTNLVVFDAAELRQPAGTVRTFVGKAMDEFLGSSRRSAHEVGLLDLMDIARITGNLPENRALIGIQPEAMGWGMQPGAAVRDALDTAAAEAFCLIRKWQKVNPDQGTPSAEQYHDRTSATRLRPGHKYAP
jgi:hydrogenase maturation protease